MQCSSYPIRSPQESSGAYNKLHFLASAEFFSSSGLLWMNDVKIKTTNRLSSLVKNCEYMTE